MEPKNVCLLWAKDDNEYFLEVYSMCRLIIYKLDIQFDGTNSIP